MTDHSIDLAEYDRLRQEIDNRTQIANGLVGLELTALGGGLAAFSSFPDVVIGLAVFSAALWLLWVDHASQIWKLAAYISIELGERLRADLPGALGWEQFLRRLDSGGAEARGALRLPASTARLELPKTSNVGLYISMLFGGSPAVLLFVATVSLFEDMGGDARAVRIVAVAGALVVAIAALREFLNFRRLATTIDTAIAHAREH